MRKNYMIPQTCMIHTEILSHLCGGSGGNQAKPRIFEDRTYQLGSHTDAQYEKFGGIGIADQSHVGDFPTSTAKGAQPWDDWDD